MQLIVLCVNYTEKKATFTVNHIVPKQDLRVAWAFFFLVEN